MEDTILENLAKNSDTKANCFCEDGYAAREIDIIKAVAEGLSNKEIASKLFISEGTVKIILLLFLQKKIYLIAQHWLYIILLQKARLKKT